MEAVKIVDLQWKDGADIKAYDPGADGALFRAYGLLWNLAYRSGQETLVVDPEGVLLVGLSYCGEVSCQPRNGRYRVLVVEVPPEVASFCRRAERVEREAEIGRELEFLDCRDACRREQGASRRPDGVDVEVDQSF